MVRVPTSHRILLLYQLGLGQAMVEIFFLIAYIIFSKLVHNIYCLFLESSCGPTFEYFRENVGKCYLLCVMKCLLLVE